MLGTSNRSIVPEGCQCLLFHSQARQRLLQKSQVDCLAASMFLYIFEFVKGPEKSQLRGSILFSLVQWTAMALAPCGPRAVGKKDAHRIRQLAVGSDVEDEFRGGSFRIVRQRRTFAHEVVLVNVSLRSRVSLHAADGWILRHGNIMGRAGGICPSRLCPTRPTNDSAASNRRARRYRPRNPWRRPLSPPAAPPE